LTEIGQNQKHIPSSPRFSLLLVFLTGYKSGYRYMLCHELNCPQLQKSTMLGSVCTIASGDNSTMVWCPNGVDCIFERSRAIRSAISALSVMFVSRTAVSFIITYLLDTDRA